MNKTIKYLIMMLLLSLLFTGLIVKADTGPKPAVYITLNDFPDDEIYVSLLSSNASNGPYQSLTDEEINQDYYSEMDHKFYEYSKTQDFFFWGGTKKITKSDNVYSWTYYPPNRFKIICYIESIDRFVVSDEILERYAFSSYFKLDVVNKDGTYVITNIKKNYNYFLEIVNLLLRIVLTFAIELTIAYFLFHFKDKTFVVIVLTNLITQVGLNVFLNLTCYNYGILETIIYYIIFEILIFIVEALIYSISFKKINSEYKIGKIILYALLSNALSFIFGYLIIRYVPGLV